MYYILSMTNINIIPIFNQSAPGVWEDFAYICADTMRTNYNYKMDDCEIHDTVNSDVKKWRRGTHFAFGAYDGDRMIGYIQGDATGRCATIQSLYVLADYQKQHIGRRLLQQVERAATLFANRTELIALAKAEPFYRAHGYRSMYSNVYAKALSNAPRCDCLPVFKCVGSTAKQLIALNPDFDAAAINKEHLPAFAYFDVNSRIVGYSVGENIVIDPACGLANIVRSSLVRNLTKVR